MAAWRPRKKNGCLKTGQEKWLPEDRAIYTNAASVTDVKNFEKKKTWKTEEN